MDRQGESIKQLKNLSTRGVFPLEGESMEKLLLRASFLLKQEAATFPEAAAFKKQWDFYPDWARIKKSSQGLSFFEKGATFIDLRSAQEPAYIHVKKASPAEEKEVISHELIHAVRCWLQSPRFEEPIAYMSSASKFRRYFGASFRKPLYTWAFLFTSTLPLLAALFVESTLLLIAAYLVPLIYLIYCMAFSYYDHHLLKKCINKLTTLMPFQKATMTLLALDDKGIYALKKCPETQLKDWINQKAEVSLLWRFIKASFLN